MKRVDASIYIACNPQRALEAFVFHKHLQEWWGVERSLIEQRIGGVYSLVWQISEGGLNYISTGIIKEYKYDEVLAIENYLYFCTDRPILGPLELLVKVTPAQGGTMLSICQSGYQETSEDWKWYYDIVKEAWPEVLKDLKKYLESQTANDKTETK